MCPKGLDTSELRQALRSALGCAAGGRLSALLWSTLAFKTPILCLWNLSLNHRPVGCQPQPFPATVCAGLCRGRDVEGPWWAGDPILDIPVLYAA